MSTSHPLHPFFTTFEPVAHPLLPIVLAMVLLFFPMVSEAVHFQFEYSLIAHGPERPPVICNNLEQSVAASCKHNDSKSNRIVWMLTMISAWRRSCLEVKVGENLAGECEF